MQRDLGLCVFLTVEVKEDTNKGEFPLHYKRIIFCKLDSQFRCPVLN